MRRAAAQWQIACPQSSVISSLWYLRPGGMHLIARFTAGVSDLELAQLAQTGGLSVEALSSRATTPACGAGLLLGFTNIAETDAPAVCRWLHRMIGKPLDNKARNG